MDGHVADVVDQEPDGSRSRCARQADPVRLGARAEVAPNSARAAERRPLLGIGDDDEVPVLLVARDGRLLREEKALLEHLPLDRPPRSSRRRTARVVDSSSSIVSGRITACYHAPSATCQPKRDTRFFPIDGAEEPSGKRRAA